jgi:hypothetical protein
LSILGAQLDKVLALSQLTLLLQQTHTGFPGMPNPVTETEVNNINESKLNMQIATIDEEGYPTI